MTVAELIAQLSKFPKDAPVSISDGYECRCYTKLENCKIEIFVDENDIKWCDIGVGGCEYEEPSEEEL